ncbi:hypothetical protein [Longimicrobium sp.]|uniref:hypothetical protein n=1 Tax=Longimicrobium sp. TaxID=2029185 RepID=UPI002E31AB94|nr:hypothetical protein [Longimicrobium sp.]HEX6040496.1 hypothetical protein [Longimicrobium sp.]
MSDPYLPPVDRLLKLGAEPARRRTWPDYRTLGLEPRHVPALVRMATDPALLAAAERDPASWAPVHAWRALGQMEAQEAAGPMLRLLETRGEDFWVQEELPDVLGMIGPAALHGATLLLFDEDRHEEMRMAAGAIITNVAFQHPDRRAEAAAVLVKQLEDWAHQSRALNSFLIAELVALGEKAAAPVMEAAFAAGAVNERESGSWQEVQVALGLVAAPETPWADEGWDDGRREGSRTPSATADAKARARRKAEKAARKRNRKKK